MLTYISVQLLLACLALTFKYLTVYQYIFLPAQFFILLYTVFPFERLRFASLGTLAVSAVALGIAWLISAVRTWRYFFFPTKEDATFFAECLVRVFSILLQLVFCYIQLGTLLQKKQVQPRKRLYNTCIYILFFHDFVYAGLFTYTDDYFILFGFTQFVVHTVMLALSSVTIEVFQYVWTALLAQHVYVFITYDDLFIRIFTLVYITANILYLINSSLQHQSSIITLYIRKILQ